MEALINTSVVPEHVKTGIEGWLNLIKSKDVKTIHRILNYGKLEITREEYNSIIDPLLEELGRETVELLSMDGVRINYYFGFENEQLVVYIIDSNSDMKRDYSRLITKYFNLDIDLLALKDVEIDVKPEMSREEFLERVYNWNLFSYNWIERQLNPEEEKEEGMFEGISNPIADFSIQFSHSNIKKIYHTFGLKYSGTSNGIDLKTIVHKDLVNYTLDYFCSYVCRADKGKEQYLEVSWPTFSKEEKNRHNKVYKYSLFDR